MTTRLPLAVLLLLSAWLPLAAQSPDATEHTESNPAISGTTDTLRTLQGSYEIVLEQLVALRKRHAGEKDETVKADLTSQIASLEKRRLEIEADFMQVASGVSENDFVQVTEKTTTPTVQEEFNALIMPLIGDLRELTKRPRAIEDIQQQITAQEARMSQAQAALLQINSVIDEFKADPHPEKENAAIMESLKKGLQIWQSRQDDAANRVKVLRYQLTELRKTGADFWGQLALSARKAVFTRGLNILLALLTFVVVLAALRAIYFYVMKYVPLRQYQRLNFAARLLDVLHQGVSILLAIVAALFVLYIRGDWLLGSLAVLTLVGLILAAKSGLTHYLEQVRMLLNLGSVREGERVFINGVPWKVGRINLYTQLTNPSVGGPGLRLPLEQLMQMTSRLPVKEETWFPCKKNDSILINGTDVAKVLSIGPEYVELDVRGGQHRWIATADFMKLDVASLHNGFSVSTTFGIDYAHQAEATTTIPRQLTGDIEAGLLKLVDRSHLLSVIAEFKNASASSLDYIITARFTGDQAENYGSLSRALQRLAVDSANQHGWSIPFPQLVMHQVEEPPTKPSQAPKK
jgi:flagellar biosynthesis regulator FlbT